MAGAFDKAILDIQKRYLDIFSRTFLQMIGEKFKQIIYRRVKSGYGVDPVSRSQTRLIPLTQEYVDYRKDIAKGKNKRIRRLGAFGSPTKSNLTLSGFTLESIEIEIKQHSVVLFFPDKAHPVHKEVTIRDIAQYVQEQGRVFFYLTEGERRILLRDVNARVREKFRRS